jgi:hypothetical protein
VGISGQTALLLASATDSSGEDATFAVDLDSGRTVRWNKGLGVSGTGERIDQSALVRPTGRAGHRVQE